MSSLSFASLRAMNVARSTSADGWNHPLSGWDYNDWTVALGGEVGEALNLVKKLNRLRDGIIGNASGRLELLGQLSDELADAVIYLDLLLASQGQSAFLPADEIVDFESLRRANLRILADPVLYSQEVADGPISTSAWCCVALHALGRLAASEIAEQIRRWGSRLMGLLDQIANAEGIDLEFAVIAKFNATSVKHGMPHFLADDDPRPDRALGRPVGDDDSPAEVA